MNEPRVEAWLLLCDVRARLDSLAELPREVVDQRQLQEVQMKLWELQQRRAA